MILRIGDRFKHKTQNAVWEITSWKFEQIGICYAVCVESNEQMYKIGDCDEFYFNDDNWLYIGNNLLNN